ncbi:MAG: diaminopimelate decarboxylase [Acidobacteriales bacterium]|nr:diaminopimelate decarboxylase [Terriglobales bacterium]
MDSAYRYEQDTLYCEQVALADVASREGTPCYVYSKSAILRRLRAYQEAFGSTPHAICYAVKANGNLSLLRLLAEEGAGFDIVSGGELFRVLKAGGKASSVVFSGVGKTADEIAYALDQGIYGFNCESEGELALIDTLAERRGVTARVAVRVNPDVDAATHPYISTGLREHKFGIDIAEVEAVYERARALKHLSMEGVSCHIGSQILDPAPMLEAAGRLVALAQRLREKGFDIRHLDLGGGVGVPYRPGESSPSITEFVTALCALAEGSGLRVLLEPGRSLVAEAGMLLTRVLYRKRNGKKEFVIVDASMTDLIRPALYGAYHGILPLRRAHRGVIRADVVGPVCETGDFLARGREIDNVLPGDLLAVCTAGAYGFAQASNYNARPRPVEVLIDGDNYSVIRTRESYDDLVRGE